VELAAHPARIREMGVRARQFIERHYAPANLVSAFDDASVVGYVKRADQRLGAEADGIHERLLEAVRQQTRVRACHVFGRVSVVVPVFNAIEETVRCLDSVIR